MRQVKTLGLLGTGVIGAGWAARALHAGVNVVAADLNPDAETTLRRAVETARPAQENLTEGMPLPSRGQLSFTTDPAEMAAVADAIQENVPEVLAVKHAALARVSEIAPEDVLILSSTSGFMPSELQEGLVHPERCLVAHPFNPVYLCPLVELVAGRKTSDKATKTATAFYEALGMEVLHVRKEVPGHLADRLLEAIWREILHALNDDIATTGELDAAFVYGPGLRFAVMGLCQTYMMGGGEGGARHFMEQFGPCLDAPWSHLEAPDLTADIVDRFVSGTEKQAAGKTLAELEAVRDECLVAIQRVLARHDMGAGRTLNAWAGRLDAEAR